ncbi:MAG: exodeoxyribonuclease VII small subunit [Planctomycetaceae bacterium]
MAKKKSKADTSETEQAPALEAAMQELAQIVGRLESGQEPLDESLASFERGMALLRVCHERLDSAAKRIEQVTGFDASGAAVTEPFDGRSTLERGTRSGSDGEEPDVLF